MRLRESTFVAANEVAAPNRARPRARFTIAHELGHAVLGHKKTRHRNVSGRAIEKIAPSIVRDEDEADRFAAAFLSPLHLAGNPLLAHPTYLVDRFGLSLKAAELRLAELQRLYRRAHNIPRPLPKAIVEYLENASKQGIRSQSLEIEQQRQRNEAKTNAVMVCQKCFGTKLTRNNNSDTVKCLICGSIVSQ
jgi:Zn-dependent peptidase ImmA (M78 family)